MNKIISTIFLVLFAFVISCDDEEEVYPQVETTEITALSASNFVVKGNIVKPGNSLVLGIWVRLFANRGPRCVSRH
jgi:hypothetical protein